LNELDLFAAAIAIADPGERGALLDRECGGDSNLRRRLDQLLDAHARSHQLFDAPHGANLDETTAQAPSEQPGETVAGRYKLLELIGEGGMGAVWKAEQLQPVRRKVALKLIKAGMDSRSVLARFDAERQALAVMDHPNIAKVLDGGLTDRGRPYFVMEYVKGVPITDYCDAARLSVSDRLALFIQVCHAVQHAHQKGIIHRDLKPSNILVAPYDDKPVPKIIDFGLAKAMHQSLTEHTLHTAHESVLGTPLYMSAEQAQLNNLDVDTRSDVYSLGVLLYELLTGTTPLEKQRFKQAAWDKIKRIIREEEPQRPSARLSSTDTLPSVAAGRQSEPLRLAKLVRGELDWIVMKSLEKDRTRRYETATGFASDVQRYLSGEAVHAHPPSLWYRYVKFSRRHRGAILSSYLLFAGTVTFVGSLHSQVDRARTAEREAVAAQQAEAERAEGERLARLEAQAKEAEADAVVKFFQDQVFAAARPKGQRGGLGKEVSLRDAIAASLPASDRASPLNRSSRPGCGCPLALRSAISPSTSKHETRMSRRGPCSRATAVRTIPTRSRA
jgi:eukaryotic-like serine/threonine-protein kinase